MNLRYFTCITSAISTLLVAGTAFAGSVSPPAIPQVLVPPAPVIGQWEGAYTGVFAGTGFNGTDPLAGFWAGYNFQNGNLVYGGELDVNYYTDGTGDIEAFLRGRLGYALGEDLLVFAALGTGRYFPGGGGAGTALNIGGLGAEFAVNDKVSLRFDYDWENTTGSSLFSGPNFVKLGASWHW